MKTQAVIGVWSQAKKAGNDQKLEKAKNRFDPSGFQASRLQNSERVSFCCFKS